MNTYPAPEEIYQELFTDVHQAGFLPDGKAFSDALPLRNPQEILERYRNEKQVPGFDLADFIKRYFAFPQSTQKLYQSDLSQSPQEHIHSLWEHLTRKADDPTPGSSLIPLPYPYIVPGGRFNEIYYWDSYFTMLGLRQSGRTDMIESMIRNFSYLIDQFGFIPNGNRSYFLSRSQPPFYACMVSLLAEERGEDILVEYLPFLKKEHAYWMGERQEHVETDSIHQHTVRLEQNILLNRYWDRLNSPRAEMYGDDEALARSSNNPDPQFFRHIRAACESGWDFSSRWLKDPMDLGTIHTLDILPIDLNCLLWNLEQVLARAYAWAGIPDQEARYQQQADERKSAIQRIFWDDPSGFFRDFNFVTHQLAEIDSLAGMYPLFFGLATEQQAAACAHRISQDFLKPGGVVTTAIHSGQQWDAPNGWAPLQWITVQGLRNYGHFTLAEEIRNRWLALNTTVYQRTGKMLEKYNVEDLSLEGGGGEYPVQDGFGWTNGVYLCLLGLTPEG